MITGRTALFCILADPIGHVRTPQVFNDHLHRIGADAVVVPAHVAREHLADVVGALRAVRNLRGIIVTLPHKIDIVALCDDLDESARRAGAVNVIRRETDGRLRGANFDGLGFVSALESAVGSIVGRAVYLAGAGGAARAIAFELARAGVSRLALYNRSAAKADALLQAVAQSFPQLPGARATAVPDDCDIAINATSLGLGAADPLPFAIDALPAGAIVAEVIMQPRLTPLLQRAHERGLRIVTGDAMLGYQLPFWVDFFDSGADRPLAAQGRTQGAAALIDR